MNCDRTGNLIDYMLKQHTLVRDWDKKEYTSIVKTEQERDRFSYVCKK